MPYGMPIDWSQARSPGITYPFGVGIRAPGPGEMLPPGYPTPPIPGQDPRKMPTPPPSPFPQRVPIPAPGTPGGGWGQTPMPTPREPTEQWKQSPIGQQYAERERRATTPQVEITPFIETMYGTLRNVEPEQRQAYLQNTMTNIKSRLDRYEFRMARGLPLTAEQQQQYNSMKNAMRDIQNYLAAPHLYEQFFQAGEENAAVSPLGQARRRPLGVAGQPAGVDYYQQA